MPLAMIGLEMIHYIRETGIHSGCPLLCFIHGAGGNCTHWVEQVAGLKHLGSIIAVDLPGHGQSQGSGRKTIREYSQFVHQFLAHITAYTQPNHPGVILAGHSMGGGIVMDYALQHPNDLKGAILVATGAKLRVAPQIFERIQAGPEHVADLVPWFFSSSAKPELLQRAREELCKVKPQVLYNDFRACDQFDLTEKISMMRVPSLIICGQEDRLTPIKYAQYLQDHIPDSRVSVIEEAGHMVMLEQAKKVNQAIEDFVLGFKN